MVNSHGGEDALHENGGVTSSRIIHLFKALKKGIKKILNLIKPRYKTTLTHAPHAVHVPAGNRPMSTSQGKLAADKRGPAGKPVGSWGGSTLICVSVTTTVRISQFTNSWDSFPWNACNVCFRKPACDTTAILFSGLSQYSI
jgi:hypothetical protein